MWGPLGQKATPPTRTFEALDDGVAQAEASVISR